MKNTLGHVAQVELLFLHPSRLCREQRVVGSVHPITLEIETADHDNPLARYSSTFRQLISRKGRSMCYPSSPGFDGYWVNSKKHRRFKPC